VATLPLGQYYHVALDNERPYNVYGGMQDNGSWKGPNTTWETTGIRNWDWQEVGFGDGFGTAPIPTDPMTGYAMSQEGYIVRWNLRTGERKDIRPAPPASDEKLRFNWNAAIAIDPFDPNGVYFGSQYVHKSSDRGETWTTISPDLTTNNKDWQHQDKTGGVTPDVTGAENFTTIIALAPSAVDRNVIWAGTDDGRVQVTRDGGKTWTSVEANVKGVPPNTWVPELKASRTDPATAFVVFDDHRRSNWTTYAYHTSDYGKTWTSVVTKDVQGYALSIEQDPVDSNLLFLGTEFGLWVTTDGGRNWMKWKHGFPTVSVMGLAIHPRENDLVIATHGRAAFVIDDIAPLRTISASTLAEPLHFFPIPDAQAYTTRQKKGSRFLGDAEFRGENEPYGALLTYSLSGAGLPHPSKEKERELKEKKAQAAAPVLRVSEAGVPQDIPKEPVDPKKTEEAKPAEEPSTEVSIEVADASGAVIRKFKGPAKLGVNRTAWGLQRDAFKQPKNAGESAEERSARTGPEVPPGDYTVTMKFRDHEAKQTVHVVADPRETFTPDMRKAKYEAILRAGRIQEEASDALERIQKARADIDAISAKVTKDDEKEPDALVKSGKELKEKLAKLERRLWTPPDTKGIVADTDVLSRLSYPLDALQSSWDAPTAAQLEYVARAERLLRSVLTDLNRLFDEDVAKYREEVKKRGVGLLM
jgi:hypothetical protein